MNETDWLTSVRPGRMLWYMQKRASERKFLLFSAACLRRIWRLLPGPGSREVVELLERLAEGEAVRAELDQAREKAQGEAYAIDSSNRTAGQLAGLAAFDADPEYIADNAAEATAYEKVNTPDAISTPEELAQAKLVREIFGNPFQPVDVQPSWLAWKNGLVSQLAKGIYADRAFERLPILADALEEAGCDAPGVLEHCRQPGTHLRGCWVVDLFAETRRAPS